MNAATLLIIILLSLAFVACEPALPTQPVIEDATPAPDVVIAFTPTVSAPEILLEGVQLQVTNAILDQTFPVDCAPATPPACHQAGEGLEYLSVVFTPVDLSEGQMLAYKNLPPITVLDDTGTFSANEHLLTYNVETDTLTLGFEVPANAHAFELHWAENIALPLEVE